MNFYFLFSKAYSRTSNMFSGNLYSFSYRPAHGRPVNLLQHTFDDMLDDRSYGL
ncbi:hypothetical protein CBM2592_A190018 [Cupriavidus taiwanensis]|nr:hypothetical protein CBM2592_A190018 [Cupriavidus taiwanensis]SOY83042.1 hypothetical protein CBM2591_A230020 [Cupriavidus taiwanensis]SOZ56227.1 hypothetical protein CBM2617_A200027 [Cupriavidus taiwanensis]SOZ78811.1 hypothetical protein CBM2618_A180026 [Cupriavidus taiwanensis]SOZ79085.1 hypothetical protein CBM2622_A170025 [Cupriavidus taiwanensis]